MKNLREQFVILGFCVVGDGRVPVLTAIVVEGRSEGQGDNPEFPVTATVCTSTVADAGVTEEGLWRTS